MTTYTIVISENMRRILHAGLIELEASVENECAVEDLNDADIEEMQSLTDLLDPTGSTGPLKTAGINSFVL